MPDCRTNAKRRGEAREEGVADAIGRLCSRFGIELNEARQRAAERRCSAGAARAARWHCRVALLARGELEWRRSSGGWPDRVGLAPDRHSTPCHDDDIAQGVRRVGFIRDHHGYDADVVELGAGGVDDLGERSLAVECANHVEGQGSARA